MVDMQVLSDFTNVMLAALGFESGLHPVQHYAPIRSMNDIWSCPLDVLILKVAFEVFHQWRSL